MSEQIARTRDARAISTSREIAAARELIFRALTAPDALAQWWGPAGFSNTFELCEMHPGGQWRYVMRSPDGQDFQNLSEFVELTPARWTILHKEPLHVFTLSIELEERGERTLLRWTQTFETAEECERIRHIVLPANEQNIDRLEALVLSWQ